MTKKALLVFCTAALIVGGSIWCYKRATRCRPPVVTTIDDEALLDDLHMDLPKVRAESWVRLHDTERAVPGFNLGFYSRRVPIIFDMQGRIVHSWPKVRAVGRIRLDRQGRLLVIGADNLVKEYDWDGQLIWHYQLPDVHDFPHHDIIRMENGHILILAHDGHSHADYLYEVNRDKEVVWEWWATDHKDRFDAWDEKSTDLTHSNSIRELPPNRFFAGGDERFRPGNILVSARSLNTIFIIDKGSGKVAWQYSDKLDHQHEAVMTPAGRRGDGLIMVFNNGRDSLHAHRRSTIQAIDPSSNTVAWEYGSPYFFSTIAGTAQLLRKNNILITSSHGGRAFEIKSKGRIVWEWAPPFKPMRLERLPLDHCPQLAALTPVSVEEVLPDDPRPFVDADLYGFALPEEVERREIADKERKIVPVNEGCREIFLPPDGILRAEYGIDRDLELPGWLSGRFEMWIRGGGTFKKLVDSELGSSTDAWTRRRTTIDLGEFAYRKMRLCLSARVVEGDEDAVDRLVWGNPVIESTSQKPPGPRSARRISEQERKLQEQQLKALGYVD